MNAPVSASLLRAYTRTLYSAGPATMRIGARSPAAQTLLASCHAREALLISAWNPMSRRMPERWNKRAQHRLLQGLRRFRVIPAEGRWRAWREEHVLVFGPAAPVIVLARRYRQRAVVLVRPDGSARLVLL